ncbi:MAG: glycosyltransferase [Vicinamibacterales bacterium]
MRVLMVTSQLPSATQPGTMAPVARQIASMREVGIDVDVVEVRGARRLKYLHAVPGVWERAARVDLVHAHYGYCGWLARVQLAKPVVVSFMGDDLLGTPDTDGRTTVPSRLVVQANRRLARIVDAVIVKSQEMARIVAPVNAHVVPNGVDLQSFTPMEPAEARLMLGWTDDKHYVLFPGNPAVPRKGHALASAAAARAAPRMRKPIELRTLRGISPLHVPLYMNACDAMLMTSLLEGSPNVVKEAMACNLPVVSVEVGDVSEMLAGVHGCALCPRDAELLGRALSEVLACGQRTTGRAALQSKELDLTSVARRVKAIYETVLDRRG